MTERTFTITLTETEKLTSLYGLSFLRTAIPHSAVDVHIETLIQKLCKAAGSDVSAPVAAPFGTEAARAVLSPPELRDRWARDRKGKELPNPAGCESTTVLIIGGARADLTNGSPRLKVSWAVDAAKFQGNCFDELLFPWLLLRAKEKKETVIYTVKSGQYTNVVGVRA